MSHTATDTNDGHENTTPSISSASSDLTENKNLMFHKIIGSVGPLEAISGHMMKPDICIFCMMRFCAHTTIVIINILACVQIKRSVNEQKRET